MPACPSCQKSAMARWKKLMMSPLAPMPCDSCDTELGVTWRSYLLAISLGTAIFAATYFMFEDGSLDQYLGYGVGFILMLLGQLYFMPIHRVQVKEQQ